MTEEQKQRIVSAAHMIERLLFIEQECLFHGEFLIAADYAEDCERIAAEAFRIAAAIPTADHWGR